MISKLLNRTIFAGVGTRKAGKPRLSRGLRRELVAYLCILPWMIGFLGLSLGPMLASFILSFAEYPILRPPEFVGIKNYVKMFTRDELFWHSLKVTVIYTMGAVPIGVIGGYLLALLLNQRLRGLSFWREAFYIPSIVPVIASAYLWSWLLHPSIGLVNGALELVGIEGPKWFGAKEWVMPSFILMSSWGMGASLLLYLAALQGVPSVLYDVAKVDGANAWRQFRHVTLPMTSPVVLFTFLTSLIGTFQVFTAGYIITDGGPGYASLFYILYLYRNAFKYLYMGYASALAWVLFVIIFGLTLLTLRVSGRMVHYEAE